MSHATPGRLARQVADTCRDLVAQPGLPFAQHLPADRVLDTFRDLGGAYRPRVYTPATTLWAFLHQCLDPDHSCQQAVDRLLAYRAARTWWCGATAGGGRCPSGAAMTGARGGASRRGRPG